MLVLYVATCLFVCRQRAAAEDFDEDEQEALEMENEAEEELYDQVIQGLRQAAGVDGGEQGVGADKFLVGYGGKAT